MKFKDTFKIGGKEFSSRLIMGTALYPNQLILKNSLEASETQIVTVSIRRFDVGSNKDLLKVIRKNFFILPNTAGCYSAKEAILTAELGREALKTDWVKLEIIGDDQTLLPDSVELLKCTNELVKKGFKVLAYCSDDPIICKKLEDLGCCAVMPLISPIGSALGIRNEHNLELIKENCKCNLIVDAGIGKPSDAARVMEMGFDGVLLNSSVARALDPIEMAKAMKLAVIAGRKGYLSGLIEKDRYAKQTTMDEGKISNF